jgi:16S rRNA (adenine1518-N6/adenine1519-N6)-dimethyltransferase
MGGDSSSPGREVGETGRIDQENCHGWHTDLVTHGPAHIHELLAANDLRPSRALGQNFVADANTVRRVVRLSGVTPGHPVVEIGAGLGSLTLALAEAGARVTAVEIDRHLLPVLRSEVEPLGVRVIEGDAMTLSWPSVLSSCPGPWSLVANLPYNVAVPVVLRALEDAPQITSLLIMVQREVGERLAAGPGHKSYGAVSVKVAYWATAVIAGRVSAAVFIPRPRVESVLVRLVRHATAPSDGPGTEAYERLFSVVRAGFAHRRKMLRRSLDGVVVPEAFGATGIPATARAEELDLDAWTRLASWRPPGEDRRHQPAPASGTGGP